MIQKATANTFLSIFLFFLTFNNLYSQDKGVVVAFGKLKVEWGNLDNSKIILYQDGKQLDKFYPADNGKFQFNLLLNHQYLFWFEKPGYVTKKVDFNTYVPTQVTSDLEFEPFPDFDFYVTLFKTYPDVDTMFFTNPVGKIKYDAKLNDFDYDKEYNLEIQRHMDEIEEQIKQKHDKEVNETVEKIKQPEKEVKKQEIVQNQAPDSNPEKKPVEIPANDSGRSSQNEKPVKMEIPKNNLSETPGEVAVKKNQSEVSDVIKANTQSESYSINQVSQADEATETSFKKVIRTAITSKDITLVYIKVEYRWGGRFFFIEDEPNHFRNISEVYYNLMVQKKQ